MAIEDWIHWDVDSDDMDRYHGEPYKLSCKWCGKNITMTPTDKGWKPIFRGKLHVCDERKAAQTKKLIDAMPDLSLPECQFCANSMVWVKGNLDYSESWSSYFFMSCLKCGARGPRIEHGHPDYKQLFKDIK